MRDTIQQDPNCFICRKHRGEISIPGGAIYQDDLVYAGHAQIREGQITTYLGYLMVEPKRHADTLADLTDEEAQALGLLITRLSRALIATENAERVYLFVINELVHHVHFHVVARYPSAPREYWGPRVDEWQDAPHGGPQEIAALCRRIQNHLSSKQ
ncbi:MAG TPA: HIT domain-containing protein [Anaerolineae bacterium]|nr:HIT domain-containing protein [Anaerolineae bacterium]